MKSPKIQLKHGVIGLLYKVIRTRADPARIPTAPARNIPRRPCRPLPSHCRETAGPLRRRLARERASALFEVDDLLADRGRAADDRRLDDPARVVREEVARAGPRPAVHRAVGRAGARGRTCEVPHVRPCARRDAVTYNGFNNEHNFIAQLRTPWEYSKGAAEVDLAAK